MVQHTCPSPARSSTDPVILLFFSYLKSVGRADRAGRAESPLCRPRTVPSRGGEPAAPAGPAPRLEVRTSAPLRAGEGAGQRMSPSLRGLLSGAAVPREPLGGAKVKVKRLPKPLGGGGRSHVTAGKRPGRTGLRRAINGRRSTGLGGGGVRV